MMLWRSTASLSMDSRTYTRHPLYHMHQPMHQPVCPPVFRISSSLLHKPDIYPQRSYPWTYIFPIYFVFDLHGYGKANGCGSWSLLSFFFHVFASSSNQFDDYLAVGAGAGNVEKVLGEVVTGLRSTMSAIVKLMAKPGQVRSGQISKYGYGTSTGWRAVSIPCEEPCCMIFPTYDVRPTARLPLPTKLMIDALPSPSLPFLSTD
ncbi:hypothetical protein GGR56DRAFT_251613 [Xylariaceae sp. FL0804]|nr:hypothetical protein GGR56DRAFT_251613 [Xylariaceae sp. FL0804]